MANFGIWIVRMEELHLVGRMLDVLHGAWIGKPGDWLCFFLSSSTSRSRVLDTEKDTCKKLATAWYFNDTFAYDTCINGKLNYAFYVYGIHTYALYFYW
jgi:hypothetical protein